MTEKGYTWQAHDVQTDDGYILTLFHITGTTSGPSFAGGRKPILLQHTIFDDSLSWLEEAVSTPLAFELAPDYDIWLGNARGTRYSLRHTSYTESDSQFWQWSFAEIGLYDTKAFIAKIKQQTAMQRIYYIGISQSATSIVYALSKQDSVFRTSLHGVIGLAPCFVQRDTPPSASRSNFVKARSDLYKSLGIYN